MFCCLLGALAISHFIAHWRKYFSKLGYKHDEIEGEYDWKPEDTLKAGS